MEDVLYRVAKFEVKPSEAQLAALTAVSENLRCLWNLAVEARERAYALLLEPVYREIGEAQKAGDKALVAELKALLKLAQKHPDVVHNGNAFAQQKHLLTPLRAEDPEVAAVPRVWQNNCLVTIEAAFKSYFQLKKKGDPKARRPTVKPEGHFQEISAKDTAGFRLSPDRSQITLPCKKIAANDVMTFPIPAYQQQQLRGGEEKKFILYRDRSGRFWISIAFEISAPEEQPFFESLAGENRVYLSLGSTAIGILAPPLEEGGDWREEVIRVPRPDVYWKPRIDAVSLRMKKLYRKDAERQSEKYNGLKEARRVMFDKLARQQQQTQRQTAQRLLALGGRLHFVATELVVRAKPGKLADGTDAERGGSLGQNWAAQNTGWLSNMLAWLKIKASERGSRVEIFKLEPPHPREANLDRRKLAMARLLRERYLASRA
ncbi:MAG: hypothetical protein ABH826_00240 [Patescibacteria group bacterium]